MKPLSLCFLFLLLTSLRAAELPPDRDSVNVITRQLVLDGVAKSQNRHLTAAQAFDNGAFRGFQASPGSTLEDADTPLIDFLTSSIVVDSDGNPDYTRNPLDIPLGGSTPDGHRLRNIRPGDKIPYATGTYPKASEPNTPPSRRYGIPFIMGGDRNGKYYPIFIGVTDYPPDNRTPDYDIFDSRDTLTMLGCFPEYMGTMGNSHPMTGNYAFTHGIGYADESVHGMARNAFPLLPNPVPKLGSLWYSCGMQKTSTPTVENTPDMPDHKKNTLVTKFVIGKRMLFRYGARDPSTLTREMDSLVIALGFNYANTHGTAPEINNASAQVERLYLTKEFGYVTRWETWACIENTGKDVIATAKQWYRENNLSKPADFQGVYTAHFEIGGLVEDSDEGYYYYDQYIKDPDNPNTLPETRRWYLIGGWDFTNISMRDTPRDIIADFANPAKIGPNFLRHLGVGVDSIWTGAVSGDLADPANWQHPGDLPQNNPAPYSYNLNIPTDSTPAILTDNHSLSSDSMDLAFDTGNRANLTIANSTLSLPYHLTMAEKANTRASLSITGNSHLSLGNLYAASMQSATADITLSQSVVDISNRAMLGRNGTLSLTLQDDSRLHAADTLQIAYNPASNSSITLTGNSSLMTPQLQVAVGNNTRAQITLRDSLVSNGTVNTAAALADFILAQNGTLLLESDHSTIHAKNISIAESSPANATLNLRNSSTLSTFFVMDLAKNGHLNATLSQDSLIEGRYDLNIAENGHAIIHADNSTFNSTRNFTFAKNGTAEIILSNGSKGTTRNMSFASDGNLSLILSGNSSLSASTQLSLAANPGSIANISLTQSTLNTKQLTLGLGGITFNIVLSSLSINPAPFISAETLDVQGTPVFQLLSGRPLGLPLRPGDQTTIPLLQTTVPTDAPAFTLIPPDLDPAQYATTLQWNEEKTLLQAVITNITKPSPSYSNAEQLLLYAFTHINPITGGGITNSTGGKTWYLPTTNTDNGTLSITFTPTREELTYEVQQSPDLQTWATIHTQQGNSSQTPDPVTIPAESSSDPPHRLFLRVKVTPPDQGVF